MDSGYTTYTSDVVSLQDRFNPSEFSINGEMLKNADFSKASLTTPLDEIFAVGVDHITLTGQASDGSAVNTTFNIAGQTLQDLLNTLDTTYDADNSLSFRLENGKIKFTKQDNTLTGNVSQIVTADNSFNGQPYLAEIALKSSANGGSEFSIDTNNDGVVDTTYPIYNVANPRTQVDADEMTYGQLGDVINMIVTNTLPVDSDSSGTIESSEYDTAVENANYIGSVELTYDGKLRFSELNKTNTKAEIALEDITQSGGTNTPPALSFQLNDAITITDPKNDFFKQIDAAIESVGLKRLRPDSQGSDPRNIGIENAIQVIDDVSMHVGEVHSDIAEASLKLNQLTINYQAILSTIGRVSQLSLVNYL